MHRTISRLFTSAVVISVSTTMIPYTSLAISNVEIDEVIRSFPEGIDAFSVRLPENNASFQYAYQIGSTWSPLERYESDGDVLPGEESELIMIPRGVHALRVLGVESKNIHPITVSSDPIRYNLAATTTLKPTIISRDAWGAEDDYLFSTPRAVQEENTADTGKGDNGSTGAATVDQRARDCEAAQAAYPNEFKPDRVVSKSSDGRKYLWPLQYSKEVKLLVVHHTALKVQGDERSPVERLRALYKYHAVNRGWADIGYNFVIDDRGQIYEGRTGGSFVVGGHAYCNNVGTVGIVLMGNFEAEKPTQEQAAALQHLIADLASEYKIDLRKPARFHGKDFPSPVIGHRDLMSTLCPGYSLFGGLSQIRSNILEGRLTGSVSFPMKPSSSSSSSASSRTSDTSQFAKVADGISFVGRTSIASNPGGKQRLSFAYTAGSDGAYEGKKVAEVRLSNPSIKLWVDDGIDLIPVSKGILLPYDLPAGETLTFQLIVEAPMEAGNYTMDIGGIRFTLSSQGRRARSGDFSLPFYAKPSSIVVPKETKKSTKLAPRLRPQSRQSSSASSLSSSVSTLSASPAQSNVPQPSSSIRIRLSLDPGATIVFPGNGMATDLPVRAGTEFTLLGKGGECELGIHGNRYLSSPVVRLRSDTSTPLLVRGVKGYDRTYRGILECRIVDGTLALINELPLEEYMMGIAEEPDSEPYEKQRAFAIAARSYAAYYMLQQNRKFPGKPYDGSDDPAVFQSYAGADFEGRNPEWVRAVRSTAGQILWYKDAILKVPYFSSDDGRTLSPDEAGWKNYPNAEVFSSKPDPWCKGLTRRGHGVGMSGCGALGQAKEGRSGEQILQYYYPGTRIRE